MLCGAGRGMEIHMKKENKIRYGMGFLILIVLLILLLFLNINGGSIRLSVREILAVLGRRSSDATAMSILWNIRLPRILAALLLGGALSVSGFLLQTFFANPIAGPMESKKQYGICYRFTFCQTWQDIPEMRIQRWRLKLPDGIFDLFIISYLLLNYYYLLN